MGARNPARYTILWFFNSDCMNIPWKLFKFLRITPPEYSTREEADWNRRIRPIVTNYRLLVSASVVVFGIVKAAFAYRELSNGANTLDWIFGAVVTTIIFFTGLYENDPTHQNHLLFDQDSSPKALVIGREGRHNVSHSLI
ncbi:hypothetical protein BJ165DRAFT_438050 [Panaeolus papilionaceus]|nr:hypothetical protein BJ165DRAFT_438050 [Panaeolus papilionaceus]